MCIKTSREIVESFVPGQFIMLSFGLLDPLLKRPFSVFLTEKPDRMFILYKIRGKATLLMSKLKEGDIYLSGPFGKGICIDEDINRVILVGGGVGIAPLFSFLLNLRKKAILIAGYRSKDEFINIKEFAQDCDFLIATEDGSYGFKGKATDLLKSCLKETSSTIIISCGPEEMLKEVKSIAEKSGIPCYVSLETYMACGMGLCGGCVVKGKKGYIRVCKEGPIFKAEDICWEKT